MEERELVLKRAKSAVISRDFSLALRLYNGLLKDDVENLEYLSAIGSIYEKTNQDEKALEYYARILKRSPVDFNALNHIGGIYRRIKKYDKAIDVLKKALATGKNNAEANYNLGFTYKLTGETQKAIECFESVIAENPGDVLAYNHLGSIYYDNKEYNKSILTYKMGLQIDSNHPVLQYNLAKSYEAIKDDANAISAYECALRAKPLWIDAVKDYSTLLLKLNRTKTALEIVKKTLELHGNQKDLSLLMGKIYFKQNNYAEAKRILVKCADSSPEYYLCHEELAEVLEEEGKASEAEEEILKAESLVPSERLRETKKLAVKILLSAGKIEEAYSRLVILSDNKVHASLIDLEGQIAICTGKFENLDEIRQRIVNAKPNYYMFYTNWAYRFMQKENYAEARKYLKKHIEKNRKSLITWLYLGMTDEKLEYFESACEDYKMVLSLDPSNYLAKVRLDRLISRNQENNVQEEEEDSLPEITPQNPRDAEENLSEEEDTLYDNAENVTDLENNAPSEEKLEEENDDQDLREVSKQEDADILEIDDSVTPSEDDFNFDDEEKSLSQELLEGEDLSDFGYEMPYDEETEEENDEAEEDEDKGVFINVPDNSSFDKNRSETPEDNYNPFDYPEAKEPAYEPKQYSQNERPYPPVQNPYGNGKMSQEDSWRLNESLIKSQVNAEKAAEAAEKAWDAAQKAADSAYAVDKAEDFINKMTEDATKRLQNTAESLQNKLEEFQKLQDFQDSQNIPEAAADSSSEGFADGISETLNSSELENISNLCPPGSTSENSVSPERTETYQKLLTKVTQVLPIVENMISNQQDAENFQKEVSLFSKLKDFGEFLPEEQKQSFMTSRMRVLLDFLIAKLSGKPGLLKTSDSLRKSGIFTEKEEALLENVSPEFENCDERVLIKKVISDMRKMTEDLDDKSLAEGLKKIADEAEEKLQ